MRKNFISCKESLHARIFLYIMEGKNMFGKGERHASFGKAKDSIDKRRDSLDRSGISSVCRCGHGWFHTRESLCR